MSQRPQKPFEFPNGYNNLFGAERYRVPEIMFNPQYTRLVIICYNAISLGDN